MPFDKSKGVSHGTIYMNEITNLNTKVDHFVFEIKILYGQNIKTRPIVMFLLSFERFIPR